MVPILHTFSWRNLTQNIDNHHFIYVFYCAHAKDSNRRGSVSRYSAMSTVIDSQLEHHCIVIIKFWYFLLSILICTFKKRWYLHFFLVQQSLCKKNCFLTSVLSLIPMGFFSQKKSQVLCLEFWWWRKSGEPPFHHLDSVIQTYHSPPPPPLS